MRIYGPYTDAATGRHITITVSDDGIRKTQSTAKYLLELYLGRSLTVDETVDHINGDFTDDRIENLQILSRADNIRKSRKTHELYYFECPGCHQPAVKRLSQVRGNLNKGKGGPYCSRQCAGKFS